MNDNKSTVMNNAAVQQLRKVPGFDPMKLLRKTISVKTGHPVWKLDLRYKRLWFRLGGNFSAPRRRMRSTWRWKTPVSASSSAT